MRQPALASLGFLLILAVAGCAGAAGAGRSAPAIASNRTSLPAATASARPAPTPTSTPIPSPTPSPTPVQDVWTTTATTLLDVAGDEDAIDAHVGPGFPLTLTGVRTAVAGTTWYQATWSTSSLRGLSWVAAAAIGTRKPSGLASASFDALDPGLAKYLAGLGDRVGVEVYDVTRGITFGYNENRAFTVASSIKVPIMCAFLALLEAEGREPTAAEKRLLQTMIENSNNGSASALYAAVGDAPGLTAYMKKIGVTGLTASAETWGWSTNTASGMVQILTLLQKGKILTEEHRELALYYMEHVEKDQQVGVEQTAPVGSTVAMKAGWVNQPNGLWAMSSHGIVSYKGETYVVSVFTGDGSTLQQGFDRANHICEAIADDLTGTE